MPLAAAKVNNNNMFALRKTSILKNAACLSGQLDALVSKMDKKELNWPHKMLGKILNALAVTER